MPRLSVGFLLILAGIALIGVGTLVSLGAFSWFGRLPGDIRIERPNTRVHIPIVSSLVVSALLSIGLALVLAILRRFR
jgi:hypothetical protein